MRMSTLGDSHDEQEGSAPGRFARRRPGRTHHERAGSDGAPYGVRQFQRVKRRFREHGARGLLHQLRGRLGNRHLAPEVREQIATLMTTTYAGFNDVHLTEKLQEVHGLSVSRSAVRRLRRALGQLAKCRRPNTGHRDSDRIF